MLNNLIIYPVDQPVDTVLLDREQTFGDTEEIYFQRLTEVEADSLGRVFIVEGAMGNRTVYVFRPDGSYLTSIGRQGDGPGEFYSPFGMKIKGSRLYIYDTMHQRVNIFSLHSLSFSHSVLPKANDIKGSSLSNYFVRGDGNFLMGYQDPMVPNEPDRYIHYYIFDQAGDNFPDRIFEQKATIIFGDKTNGVSITTIVPFRGRSLIALSSYDQIFSAWTEDFLIKVYDPNGNYLRSYYYPYAKSELDRDTYLNNISRKTFRHAYEKMDFPETWPALNSMFIDDENRLWISTIVDDQEVYQWWVLDAYGELLARFIWPRDKSIEEIKNSYLYTIEEDEKTGLQQVVRYRIEIS